MYLNVSLDINDKKAFTALYAQLVIIYYSILKNNLEIS